MANKNAPALVFTDENEVPTRQGRPSNIPPELLDALNTMTPKSVTVSSKNGADDKGKVPEVEAFRAMVRRAADSLDMGADTSWRDNGDGTYKVYFQGRNKRGYNR